MSDEEGSISVQFGRAGLPILDQFSAEGFVDCSFQIQGHTCEAGAHRFHVAAEHDGKEVGFDAVAVDGIRGGFDPDVELIAEHVYHRGVQFLRSGPESDRLVAVLGELYGLRPPGNRMAQSVTFTAIALHVDEEMEDMRSCPIKIKLFGNDSETDDEEDYFESFFNLDLGNGWAFWNEKDPDYRAALLRGVSDGEPAPRSSAHGT